MHSDKSSCIFGIDLPAGAGYLLERQAEGFAVVHIWPNTPETRVFAAADFE